jgi:hypothetical protein
MMVPLVTGKADVPAPQRGMAPGIGKCYDDEAMDI